MSSILRTRLPRLSAVLSCRPTLASSPVNGTTTLNRCLQSGRSTFSMGAKRPAEWIELIKAYRQASILGPFIGVVALYQLRDYVSPSPEERFIDALINSEVEISRDLVSREVSDAAIVEAHVKDPHPAVVLVLTGQRGIGKSTEACRKLEHKKGVVKVRVGVSSESGDILSLLPAAVGVSDFKIISTNHFRRLVERAAKIKGDPSWRPIIVAEIGNVSNKIVSQAAENCLKGLVADDHSAHGVLVLGDDSATFAMDQDRFRIIYCRDFSVKEANDYLDGRKVLMGNQTALREQYFEMLGTRAAGLVSFADKVAILEKRKNGTLSMDEAAKLVQDAFSRKLMLARADILGLITIEPRFKSLFQDLLFAPYDVGVPVDNTVSYLGMDPIEAAECFRNRPAVMFDETTSSYRFYSLAHMHAARKLKDEKLRVA